MAVFKRSFQRQCVPIKGKYYQISACCSLEFTTMIIIKNLITIVTYLPDRFELNPWKSKQEVAHICELQNISKCWYHMIIWQKIHGVSYTHTYQTTFMRRRRPPWSCIKSFIEWYGGQLLIHPTVQSFNPIMQLLKNYLIKVSKHC